jgi:hypothetical protein
MAMTQSDVLGWVAERLEWERTLADLRSRSNLPTETDAVAAVPAERLAPVEPAARELPRRKRARMLVRSPVRGMSRWSSLLRIRAWTSP